MNVKRHLSDWYFHAESPLDFGLHTLGLLAAVFFTVLLLPLVILGWALKRLAN